MFKTVESTTTERLYEILSHVSGMWPGIAGQQNDNITKQAPSLMLKGMSQFFLCCTVSSNIVSVVSRVKATNMAPFLTQKTCA